MIQVSPKYLPTEAPRLGLRCRRRPPTGASRQTPMPAGRTLPRNRARSHRLPAPATRDHSRRCSRRRRPCAAVAVGPLLPHL
eukprot:3904930-Prymnesium_polylepis.1